MRKKRILVLAAHPDDEVLGCGGTIPYLRRQGYESFVCIMTDGSSSQYPNDPKILAQKKQECRKANNILGVKKVFFLDFPDMKLDTIPHVLLNNAVASITDEVRPSIVFTHCYQDINLDHQMIYTSSLVLTRSNKISLEKLYCYETLSSTEQNLTHPFAPNVFFNIETSLQTKLKAFSCYKSEQRKNPHPRNKEGIKTLARFRGLQSGYTYAEAFFLLRSNET